MLILWGMKDPAFGKHTSKIWEDNFPQTEVKKFYEAGHFLAEEITEKLLSKIKKCVLKNF
jgi:pimeloyl-ACP methyl ester carboxylesterase